MLGKTIRTRVAQAAVVTDATHINLQGGAAVALHKTFVQGFNASGAFSYDSVPVIIDKEDGTWQTAVCVFAGDSGTPSATLTLTELYESSNADNSAITLTAADPVTVTLAPIAAMFNSLVTNPVLPDNGAFTSTGNTPAFGAGKGCYPQGNHGVAIGFGNTAGGEASAVLGINGTNFWDAALHMSPGQNVNAFGTAVSTMAIPAFFARFVDTTDATPTNMAFIKADDTAGSADLYCESGITHFSAVVIAINDAGTVRRVWKLEWVAHTTVDYATTSLLGSLSKTDLYNSDGSAAAWDVDVIPDSGANACTVEVTGAAATNIAWAARVDAMLLALYP